MTPKAQATKAKIDKWNYTNLKKILYSKGKKQNEKATYGMGENICKSSTYKEFDKSQSGLSYNAVVHDEFSINESTIYIKQRCL